MCERHRGWRWDKGVGVITIDTLRKKKRLLLKDVELFEHSVKLPVIIKHLQYMNAYFNDYQKHKKKQTILTIMLVRITFQNH